MKKHRKYTVDLGNYGTFYRESGRKWYWKPGIKEVYDEADLEMILKALALENENVSTHIRCSVQGKPVLMTKRSLDLLKLKKYTPLSMSHTPFETALMKAMGTK